MEKIKLETLELEIFNKDNIEHMKFLKSLIKDKTITSRFQGLTNGLLHNHGDEFFDRGFLVSFQGTLIGYIKIGEYNERENCIYLRAAINNKERGQGYGKRLLSEITEYVFSKYEKVESIRLKIAEDNKSSLGTANACGYKWLRDDFYIAFNPYIENRRSL